MSCGGRVYYTAACPNTDTRRYERDGRDTLSWSCSKLAPSRISISSRILYATPTTRPTRAHDSALHAATQTHAATRRARRTPVPNDVHKLVRHSKCLGTNCLLWHNCKTWCHGLCHGVTVCVKPDFECQTEFGRLCHCSVARKLFGHVCVCVVCCVCLCVLLGPEDFRRMRATLSHAPSTRAPVPRAMARVSLADARPST